MSVPAGRGRGPVGFPRARTVGAESGQGDDVVDVLDPGAGIGHQCELTLVGGFDGCGAETGDDGEKSVVDSLLRAQSEGTAGGQLVRFAAAERGTDAPAANRPRDPRTGASASSPANATMAVSAEWPLPAMTVCFPANRARTASSSRSGTR